MGENEARNREVEIKTKALLRRLFLNVGLLKAFRMRFGFLFDIVELRYLFLLVGNGLVGCHGLCDDR